MTARKDLGWVSSNRLDGWVGPLREKALDFLGRPPGITYRWSRTMYSGTAYVEPRIVNLRRAVFANYYRYNEREEALMVIVHELLHILGLKHRLGFGRMGYGGKDKNFVDQDAISDNIAAHILKGTRLDPRSLKALRDTGVID